MEIDLNRNALKVAPDLLGTNLCILRGDEVIRLSINEVEAYHGFEDKASHAHRGKTPRNAVMFGPPGYWYVYLCYGVHWLLNLVTAEEDYPSAVLIRGVGPYDGPGKLTKALGIGRNYDGKPACLGTGLWIEPVDSKPKFKTVRTPRIGIDSAGPKWASKKWRFVTEPRITEVEENSE